jgi:hypothetical protein
MIQKAEISPGKRIISILSAILLFSVVFAVIIIKDNRKMKNYYNNTTEITYKDSIDLIVNKVWLNGRHPGITGSWHHLMIWHKFPITI